MDHRLEVARAQGKQAARKYLGLDYVQVPSATPHLRDRKWVLALKADGTPLAGPVSTVFSSRADCAAVAVNLYHPNACWSKHPTAKECFEWQEGFWGEYDRIVD